jgi:hypothetical protein
LATLANVDRRSLRSEIDNLLKAGHISVYSSRRGGRSTYTLLSPLFKTLENAGVMDAAVSAGVIPKTRVRCPQCSKQVPSLLKVGWCRSCNWHRRVIQIVDERLAAAKHGLEKTA